MVESPSQRMQQYSRPHVGWPIYGPPASSTHRRTPPPAPRMGRTVQLPASSAGGITSESFPTSFVLRVPPISNIAYDIRCPPATLRSDQFSTFHITTYFDLDIPFDTSRPASIRIISNEFPWTFHVHEGMRGAGVTCREVVSSLYDALQAPLSDTDWGFSSNEQRGRMARAWKRRHSLDGGRSTCLKRVDLLGGRCRLQGFYRDEDLVAQKSLPGMQPVSDTWIVCFTH
ncbi:hypothetical protein C8R43DRAFT_1076800 [Mycena crocata]|nr:hypothetical protein C8R43DRAFT_1076800 [Mycena crocata]